MEEEKKTCKLCGKSISVSEDIKHKGKCKECYASTWYSEKDNSD